MVRSEAVEYIKRVRKDGFSEEEIRQELKRTGWPDAEINAAFAESRVIKISKPQPLPPVTKPPASSITDVKKTDIEIPKTLEIRKPIQKPQVQLPRSFADVQKISQPPPQKSLVSPQKLTQISVPKPATPPTPKTPRPSPLPRPQVSSQTSLVENLMTNPPHPAAPSSTSATKIPKSNLLLVTIFAFLLIAGGSAAGFWYYTQVYPKKVLKDAVAALADVKSYTLEAEIAVNFKEDPTTVSRKIQPLVPQAASIFLKALTPNIITADPDPAYTNSFKMRMKGRFDAHDPKNFKQNLLVTLETRELLGGDIEIENRVRDGILYFQFTKLPKIPEEFGAPINTASFENKWVKVNPEALADTYNEYIDRLAAVDSRFNEFREERKQPHEWSDEDLKRVEAIWKQTQFVDWQDEALGEEVRGKKTYRFRGKLSEESMLDFLREWAKISGEEFPEGDFPFDDVELNLWVSKDNHEVVKMNATGSLQAPPDVPIRGTSEFVFDSYLSDFDTPVDVEVPEDASDFKNVLDSAFDFVIKNLEVADMKTRDTRRLAEIIQLRGALELYYDRNGAYPTSLELLTPEFIVVLPKDPRTAKPYSYKYRGPSSYRLSAKLEDPNHSSLQNDAEPGDAYYDVTAP